MVQASAADWLDSYAVPRGLHPAVIAFVRTRADLLETTETALDRGQMIAATPRSWERVSAILHAVPDRRLRDIMVAGTVGEAVAAEFALIADDIAATVQIRDMLGADARQRLAMYPATMHGLHALIYGLIASSTPAPRPAPSTSSPASAPSPTAAPTPPSARCRWPSSPPTVSSS
jgi:hypothetical protein